MSKHILHFNVAAMSVAIEEGFVFNLDGRDIESGRVLVTLLERKSFGSVDYATGDVEVDFHVGVTLPELSEVLLDMGANPELAAPVRGIIHSRGVVFEDHCFRLAGNAELEDHPLFGGTNVEILAPTRCKPDSIAMSGEEIRIALRRGDPVSWNFNPTERRVVITLPQSLGGYKHTVCLAGSYTFKAAVDDIVRHQGVAA